jgi:hypothetical protein
MPAARSARTSVEAADAIARASNSTNMQCAVLAAATRLP